MQITIQAKNVYGNEVFYPVCEQAMRLAHLANTKTLTRDALNLIKSMGFAIQVQQPQAITF